MDTSLIELDALVAGKAETQFSAAEDPDWNEVLQSCLALIQRSRDLRVGVPLSLALLMTEGLSGLRDGIALLRQLIELHWEGVYPKLDPEDNNDPLQRMNGLSGIAAPLGAAGDPMRFVERLRLMPLANSPQLGRFAFGLIADARKASSEGGPMPAGADLTQIEAAFRDTPAADLAYTHATAGEVVEQLRGLTVALEARVTAVQMPSFTELEKALVALQEIVAPYAGIATLSAEAENPAGNGSTGARISGTISSRDDVLRVLEQIRAFYASNEPASPIPLLVRRIERMVPMTFLELMTDMAPDSLSQVNTIVGPQ